MVSQEQQTLMRYLLLNAAHLRDVENCLHQFLATDEPRFHRQGDVILTLHRGVRTYQGVDLGSLDIHTVGTRVVLHPLGLLHKLVKTIHALNPHALTFLRIEPTHLLYEIFRANKWVATSCAQGLLKPTGTNVHSPTDVG